MSFAIDTAGALTALQNGQSTALGAAMGRSQAQKAAQEFESVFLSQIIGPMFENIEGGGYFGGGVGESMFRSLLVGEFGKEMAAQGGIGIGDAVLGALIKTQELAS